MANKNEQQVSEETWKRKDYLSARQTAANVTSYVFEGKEVKSEDFIKYAESIFVWLFQEQTPLPKSVAPPVNKPVAVELPTPTLEQNKILESISKQLNMPVDSIKPITLIWAKIVTGKETYPSKDSSVSKFIEWYKSSAEDKVKGK